jgi:hypothetical protein
LTLTLLICAIPLALAAEVAPPTAPSGGFNQQGAVRHHAVQYD